MKPPTRRPSNATARSFDPRAGTGGLEIWVPLSK